MERSLFLAGRGGGGGAGQKGGGRRGHEKIKKIQREIMAPEMRPKSFGSFEKRAPDNQSST